MTTSDTRSENSSEAEHTRKTAANFTHREILTVIGVLLLSILLAALDQTIVSTAIPTIAGELNGLNQISWLVTAYLLAQTIAMPIAGKLGDLFGRKRLLIYAVAWFRSQDHRWRRPEAGRELALPETDGPFFWLPPCFGSDPTQD